MRFLRMSRAAGLVTFATIGAVLVSAAPASADITVDSAVCLSNASGSLTSANPVVQSPNVPSFEWNATLPFTQCSQANGHLFLARVGSPTQFQVANSGQGQSAVSATVILRVQTSLGRRDLAFLTLTIT
jgi:hypothetical protein